MMTSDPPDAAAAASSSTAEPPEVALVRAQLAQLLDDSAAAPELEPIRTIGAGRFGATRLVRRASDGCLLCSKQIVIEQFTRRRHGHASPSAAEAACTSASRTRRETRRGMEGAA